jgi:hypothetical protein
MIEGSLGLALNPTMSPTEFDLLSTVLERDPVELGDVGKLVRRIEDIQAVGVDTMLAYAALLNTLNLEDDLESLPSDLSEATATLQAQGISITPQQTADLLQIVELGRSAITRAYPLAQTIQALNITDLDALKQQADLLDRLADEGLLKRNRRANRHPVRATRRVRSASHCASPRQPHPHDAQYCRAGFSSPTTTPPMIPPMTNPKRFGCAWADKLGYSSRAS